MFVTPGMSPLLLQPVLNEPGKHKERKVYIDPCEREFSWAASLRPSTCGRSPGDQALDQWLIKKISTCPPPEGSQEHKFYCVVGSRILQRIIGTRYCGGNIEEGRRIYLTDDIDIWVRSRADQQHLLNYLMKELEFLKEDYKYDLGLELNTHIKDLHNSDQGLFQRSIKITQTKPYLLLSSVDVSSSLTQEEASKAHISVREQAMAAAKSANERLNCFVGRASKQPMTQLVCMQTGLLFAHDPYTLSDLQYLESLKEALDNETCIDKTYDKICNTIRLLLYLEVTRRLYLASAPVDDFCIKLIEIACAHLPEQHKHLKFLLPVILRPEEQQNLPACFYGEPAKPRVKKQPAKPAIGTSTYTPREKTHAIEIVNPNAPSKEETHQPSWAEVTQTPASLASHKEATTTNPQAAPTPKQSQPVTKKKKNHKKKKDKQPAQSQAPKNQAPETQHRYLRQEELTDAILLDVSTELGKTGNHEQQLAILFDAGVRLELLENLAVTDPLAAKIVLQISKTKPKAVAPKAPLPPSPTALPEPETEAEQHLQEPASNKAKTKTAASQKAYTQAYTRVRNVVSQNSLPPLQNQYPNESQLTDWLLSQETDPPIPEQLNEEQINAFQQIGRLKQVLQLFHPAHHTGLFRWGNTPVITLGDDPCNNAQAIGKLREEPFKNCPYADYLNAMLYLEKGEDPQGEATHGLLNAGMAGVTGAAMELVRLSLVNERYTIPTSVAMALLKSCVERPAHRQYPLHFQVAPFRPPFAVEDDIIMVIKRNLTYPMTADDWGKMGLNLLTISRFLQDKKERCLLLAACTLNAGAREDTAAACYELIGGNKALAELSPSCAFDWFMQQLPHRLLKTSTGDDSPDTQTLPEPLTSWPPAMALQHILLHSSKGLEEAITALKDYPEPVAGQWASWLPYCMPRNIDLAWMSKSKKTDLKNYWKQLLKVRNINNTEYVETPEPAATSTSPLPSLTPLQAQVITPILEKNYPQSSRELAEDFREIDSMLAIAISDTDTECEDLPDSPVMAGCSKTVQALRLLGIKKENTDDLSYSLTQPTAKNRLTALALLKEAIEDYANPYACWVYARLIRSDMILNFPSVSGRQEWYEKYLSLMIYAANMGVVEAGDDLLAEALAGRADGALIAIAALIGCRYKQPAHFQFRLKLPPLDNNATLKMFKNYKGVKNHSEWCTHIHDTLKSVVNQSTDATHNIRLFWLYYLIQSFAPRQDGSVSEVSMPIYSSHLMLPCELEVSIISALDYFPHTPLTEYIGAIRTCFSPLANTLLRTLRGGFSQQAASLQCCSPLLLSWLQWQPGTAAVTGLNSHLKTLLPETSAELAKQTLPNECLMRFVWCSLIAGSKATPLPESRQAYMAQLAPWLALHQSCEKGRMITLLTPSQDLTTQAENIYKIDEELCAGLLAKTAPEDTPETGGVDMATIIAPLVSEHAGDKHFILNNLKGGGAAIATLRKLRSLEDHNPSDPYPHLIKALCLEAMRGEKIETQDIAQIGAELMHAAMLGSDCAVWHFTRLALQKNSPLSLERVIDLYLLQYQRARRHTIHFEFPCTYKCNSRQKKIIKAFSSVCLTKPQSSKTATLTLIGTKLIPALTQLQGTFKTEEANSQLNLLLSWCHQKDFRYKGDELLSKSDLFKLSMNLLHQWEKHRVIAYRKTRTTPHPPPDNLVSVSAYLPGSSLSYRMIPYILSYQLTGEEQLKLFEKWHNRTGSWSELPAMMGQSELPKWQGTHCQKTFRFDFEDRSTLFPLPGDQAMEDFQNTLYCRYTECLLYGTFLQFPHPETHEEMARMQFWYDQYCIDIDDLTNKISYRNTSAPK